MFFKCRSVCVCVCVCVCVFVNFSLSSALAQRPLFYLMQCNLESTMVTDANASITDCARVSRSAKAAIISHWLPIIVWRISETCAVFNES